MLFLSIHVLLLCQRGNSLDYLRNTVVNRRLPPLFPLEVNTSMKNHGLRRDLFLCSCALLITILGTIISPLYATEDIPWTKTDLVREGRQGTIQQSKSMSYLDHQKQPFITRIAEYDREGYLTSITTLTQSALDEPTLKTIRQYTPFIDNKREIETTSFMNDQPLANSRLVEYWAENQFSRMSIDAKNGDAHQEYRELYDADNVIISKEYFRRRKPEVVEYIRYLGEEPFVLTQYQNAQSQVILIPFEAIEKMNPADFESLSIPGNIEVFMETAIDLLGNEIESYRQTQYGVEKTMTEYLYY